MGALDLTRRSFVRSTAMAAGAMSMLPSSSLFSQDREPKVDEQEK